MRFSSNLSIMFQEVPLIERLPAAAKAGFKAIELWFPYEIPAADFARIMRDNDLICVGINSRPGDVSKGQWGMATDPAMRPFFLETVEEAMAYAAAIDCPNVHVLAGVLPDGADREAAWSAYADSIALACDIASKHGRTVIIEPLNVLDRPNYILTRQAQAISLVETLRRPNLRIMIDLFHIQRGEGNLIERMRASLPYVGHVQIADNPGRHEPGTGEINYQAVLGELERLGYTGWIGCEYAPKTTTLEGLGWMRAYA